MDDTCHMQAQPVSLASLLRQSSALIAAGDGSGGEASFYSLPAVELCNAAYTWHLFPWAWQWHVSPGTHAKIYAKGYLF